MGFHISVSAECRRLGVKCQKDDLVPWVAGEASSLPQPVISVNRRLKPEHQRFTVAMLLGYFVLEKPVVSATINKNFRLLPPVSNHVEKICVEYAQNLLMPLERISAVIESLGYTDMDDIAEELKVTPDAIKIRLGIPT